MSHRVLIPVSHPLGGIRTYMLYNFKRIHDAGFRFTFLSEAGSAFEHFKDDTGKWEGTRWIESPKGSGSRGMFRAVRSAIRSGSFSLIHSQGLKAGTEAAAANYFRRVPHFITLHDVIVPGNDIPGRLKGLKKAIISAVTRRASVLIPVTEDCKENHLALFPSWKKGPVRIETIVNGIDVDKLFRSREAFEAGDAGNLRETCDIKPGTLLGGFFGRFMPQKGFDLAIRALKILSDRGYGDRFRLVATRDPHGYLRETIRDASEDPSIARMIRFIDPVSDIAPLLCQMDLLVMPSRWEACGLLAMEAMVLGKPVVGSDCIGLREVLQNTPSLVAAQDDAESLASTLIDFIEHPTTQVAREYASIAAERFDVRIATDKLLELYRRFV